MKKILIFLMIACLVLLTGCVPQQLPPASEDAETPAAEKTVPAHPTPSTVPSSSPAVELSPTVTPVASREAAPVLSPVPSPDPGLVPPWPRNDHDPVLGVLFTPSANDLQTALRSALDEATGHRCERWMATVAQNADESVEILMRWIILGRNAHAEPLEGILVFPAPGADYTNCIALADTARIPVWIFSQEDGDAIRSEILALFSGEADPVPNRTPAPGSTPLPTPAPRDLRNGRYEDYVLNCPWPEEKSIRIYVVYPKDVWTNRYTQIGFENALRAVGPYQAMQWTAGIASDEKESLGMLKVAVGSWDLYDAVLLFPFGDTDYQPVIDMASRYDVPVWIFSSTDPETIEKELEALVRKEGE